MTTIPAPAPNGFTGTAACTGMPNERRVEVGSREYGFACDCGWSGTETEIEEWDVQQGRDRVVRRCPGCGEPVPEWGTFSPIDGVARVARGDLRAELEAAGVYD